MGEVRFMATDEDEASLERIERLVREFNEIVGMPAPRDQVNALFTAALLWAKGMEEGGLSEVRAAKEEMKRGPRH